MHQFIMNTQKIYLVCSKSLYNNEIFNLHGPHNRDNCLYPYYLFKEKIKEKGISIDTFDFLNKDSKEDYALVFFDMPRNMDYYLKNHKNAKKFLIVYESPIKNADNQKIENYQYFNKVFTWNTKVVDDSSIDSKNSLQVNSGQAKKIFWVPYSQKIPKDNYFDLSKKNKLLTAIFGHKLQTNPIELYSERIKAIEWFQENRSEDFDLYGEGWNEHYFKDKLFHLNRIKFLKKLFKPSFPSYKGAVEGKKETYQNYKFALCYENAEYEGYITEKIFDCFFGSVVPIYLGAQNVADFIPENTFIDKRRFKTYEELYNFIKNMPDEEYKKYIEAIKSYLEGEKIYPFSSEYFANTISEEISKSL